MPTHSSSPSNEERPFPPPTAARGASPSFVPATRYAGSICFFSGIVFYLPQPAREQLAPSSSQSTSCSSKKTHSSSLGCSLKRPGRRQALSLGAVVVFLSFPQANGASFAAEIKKGFQFVSDNKDGYSFLYPFGWQEVVVQGQDKVFKDVIEPLESVSINMVPTSKQNIQELGSPQEVADALIRKVLAPPTQKIKLVEASEHDVDGKAYYTFEFTVQAPNFTRHALGAITIGNGKFYTITTGANERRWEKMKDRLHTVVDSFKIVAV